MFFRQLVSTLQNKIKLKHAESIRNETCCRNRPKKRNTAELKKAVSSPAVRASYGGALHIVNRSGRFKTALRGP